MTASRENRNNPDQLRLAKREEVDLEGVGNSETISGVSPGDTETDERRDKEHEASKEKREREILLEQIGIRGRLTTLGHSTSGFSEERGRNGKAGFIEFNDRKIPDSSSSEKLQQLMQGGLNRLLTTKDLLGEKRGDSGWVSMELARNDIDSVITIVPITERKPVYGETEVVEKKPFLGFWKKEVKRKVTGEIGERKEPMSMGVLNGDEEDTEPAYEIFCYLGATKSHPQMDTRGRPGSMVQFHAILPKSLAQKAFETIQQDPGFMKEIIKQLDEEMAEEMTSNKRFPQGVGGNFLIIPEGKARDALVVPEEQMGLPKIKEVNKKYIQEVAW